MIVAVLLPTTGRPEQMAARVSDLLMQRLPKGVSLTVYLAVPGDDKETLDKSDAIFEHFRHKLVERKPNTTAVDGWNAAFVKAYHDGAEWFVLGADDIKWHPGWLEAALSLADKSGAQVIGLHDGHTNLNHYGAHYMVHREFVEKELGGAFIPPGYGSWWFDREVCEKAAGLGLYAPCWDALAEHTHPDWNSAPMDDTYKMALPLHDTDRQLYEARKADGYPVDYPSLIKDKPVAKDAPEVVEEAEEKPAKGKKMVKAAPENKMKKAAEDK